MSASGWPNGAARRPGLIGNRVSSKSTTNDLPAKAAGTSTWLSRRPPARCRRCCRSELPASPCCALGIQLRAASSSERQRGGARRFALCGCHSRTARSRRKQTVHGADQRGPVRNLRLSVYVLTKRRGRRSDGAPRVIPKHHFGSAPGETPLTHAERQVRCRARVTSGGLGTSDAQGILESQSWPSRCSHLLPFGILGKTPTRRSLGRIGRLRLVDAIRFRFRWYNAGGHGPICWRLPFGGLNRS